MPTQLSREMTLDDLQAMIGVAEEDDRLEFKVDIPVHKQASREQARAGAARPRDGWWEAKSVGEHGRNELLAEIVAFANASGGRLILGMDEAAAGPPIAKEIMPLPRIAELRARFVDMIASGVEPRLPSIQITAVSCDEFGNGVLVFDVEPSRLGPHWVRHTHAATVRRFDKCLHLDMPEVHAMVLRNSRRFDEVREVLDERAGSLGQDFADWYSSKLQMVPDGATKRELDRVFEQHPGGAYALRLSLVAHADLGIARLEDVHHLMPRGRCFVDRTNSRLTDDPYGFWPNNPRLRRTLGGVQSVYDYGAGKHDLRLMREGAIDFTFLFGNLDGSVALTAVLICGAAAMCMATYDLLRQRAGRALMPAEFGVSMVSTGKISVLLRDGSHPFFTGGWLPPTLKFPRRTISTHEDFTAFLTELGQDLLDAAGCEDIHADFAFAADTT